MSITRHDVEQLQKRRKKINPITEHLNVATGEFNSVEDMASLIADKLQGWPDRTSLWAVDSDAPDSEGWTVCITGNGPKAEDNADWIADLLTHGDGLIERCLWLENELNRMDQKSTQARNAISEAIVELEHGSVEDAYERLTDAIGAKRQGVS